MNPFNPLLKRINDKLDLSQPAKSRIVLEIAADLEDLYRIYRDRGLSEEEALHKAQEKEDCLHCYFWLVVALPLVSMDIIWNFF